MATRVLIAEGVVVLYLVLVWFFAWGHRPAGGVIVETYPVELREGR